LPGIAIVSSEAIVSLVTVTGVLAFAALHTFESTADGSTSENAAQPQKAALTAHCGVGPILSRAGGCTVTAGAARKTSAPSPAAIALAKGTSTTRCRTATCAYTAGDSTMAIAVGESADIGFVAALVTRLPIGAFDAVISVSSRTAGTAVPRIESTIG